MCCLCRGNALPSLEMNIFFLLRESLVNLGIESVGQSYDVIVTRPPLTGNLSSVQACEVAKIPEEPV